MHFLPSKRLSERVMCVPFRSLRSLSGAVPFSHRAYMRCVTDVNVEIFLLSSFVRRRFSCQAGGVRMGGAPEIETLTPNALHVAFHLQDPLKPKKEIWALGHARHI